MQQLPIRLKVPTCSALKHASNTRSVVASRLLSDFRKPDRSDRPKVTYYEQDVGPNPKRRRIQDPVEESGIDKLREEIVSLRQQMQKMRNPKSHPFLESVMPHLSKDEQERLRDAIRKQDEDMDNVEVLMPVPRHQRPLMKRMNKALTDACADAGAVKTQKELWRYYEKCKRNVPEFLNALSDTAWKLMWDTQSSLERTSQERLRHLKILVGDMIQIGRELTDAHQLMHLEAQFFSGEKEQSLERYEQLGDSAAGQRPEYLDLGVRMYAALEQPDKAFALMEKLLHLHGGWNPRIMIHVIKAYAEQPDQSGLRRAFSLYIQLREMLGKDMGMKDFDDVSLAFMSAGHKSFGLAIFRDMMLCKPDQPNAVNKHYVQVYKQLQDSSTSLEEINSTSLEALTVMPRKFQNKYFYASWLKKLIGMKETEAAAQVIELMYEQGIKPDALHVNGLIGAWMRSGEKAQMEKVEQMAWSMVHERLDFAWRRRCAKRGEEVPPKPSIYETEDGVRLPKFLQRRVPCATIETFSILLQHYLRRSMPRHARHVQNLLSLAEIPLTSYIVNHLMFADLRSHKYTRVWEKFIWYRKSITPDMESYRCLWECMKVRINRLKDIDEGKFPSVRELFADMMRWFESLDERSSRKAVRHFTNDAYQEIIRCFGLLKDGPGTLVAMHAIRSKFGVLPDEETMRLLVLLVSRLYAGSLGTNATSRIHRSANSLQAIERAKEVLRKISERRREETGEEEEDLFERDADQAGEENLNLLSEFVRVILVRIHGREKVEGLIERAKDEMEVGDIGTGDLDATNMA